MEDCEGKESGFYSGYRFHSKYKTVYNPTEGFVSRGCGMIYFCLEKISLAAGWTKN